MRLEKIKKAGHFACLVNYYPINLRCRFSIFFGKFVHLADNIRLRIFFQIRMHRNTDCRLGQFLANWQASGIPFGVGRLRINRTGIICAARNVVSF